MLNANNKFELLKELSSIDKSLPDESDRSYQDQIEKYCAIHLMIQLIETDTFSYPLSLIKRERPDFHLSLSKTQIGIEHTTCIPQNYAHKIKLLKDMDGPKSWLRRRYWPGEKKQSGKEVADEIRNGQDDLWYGDSSEKGWANAMVDCIDGKTEKLNRPGFDTFNSNWLLIFDKWPEAGIHRDKTPTFLNTYLDSNNYWQNHTGNNTHKFDRVYIINGLSIIQATMNGVQVL